MWPFSNSNAPPAAQAPAAAANPPGAGAAATEKEGVGATLTDASEAISSSLKSTGSTVSNAASNAGQYIANTGNNVKEVVGSIGSKIQNIPNVFRDVSNTSMSQNVTSWFSNESFIAKLVFVVIMLVIFFFLLRMALIMIFFLVPSWNSPYLISGVLEGSKKVELKQDPRSDSSTMIQRSKNQKSGIEFSWCLWLMINENPLGNNDLTKEFVVFCKGVPQTQAAPCLKVGIQKMTAGTDVASTSTTGTSLGADQAYLILDMETYDQNENDGVRDTGTVQSIRVSNVPMKKWVHVCIRLQNTALDIYINGNATRRIILPAVPKQNFSNIFVFPTETNTGNKAFTGYLSDLIYYPYALNTYRLNAIVSSGPNTTPSVLSSTALTTTRESDYLAPSWYSSQR